MFRFLVSHFCLQEIFQLHSYIPVFIVCPHLCPLPPRESVYEAIWLVSESHSAGGSNPSYQQLTLCTKEKKLFHCCFFPFHLMKTTKFSHFLGKLGIDDKLTQKQVKLFFSPQTSLSSFKTTISMPFVLTAEIIRKSDRIQWQCPVSTESLKCVLRICRDHSGFLPHI